ncbi:MAG TPA: hypothetical protein VEU30_05895 [Thermoanaerobaculia bacterium]|nr:hypothetical protein [Thermoanaerobaculia bacterium]
MAKSKSDPNINRILEALTKKGRAKDPVIVDTRDVTAGGRRVRLYRGAAKSDANGPRVAVAFDAEGAELEAAEVEAVRAAADARFSAGTGTGSIPAPAAPAVTINPKENVFTLAEGETVSESIIVNIPADAGVKKADIYFLADNTGSMGDFIAAVSTGASTILSSLPAGIDFAVGVGNYQDFPQPDSPYAFQHQLSPVPVPANNAAVTAAIGAWIADAGNDIPEGNFYALDRLAIAPATAPINWRAGSKRIIVQFGDAPSHDPICTNFTGDAANITEASVTAKLQSESISVIAISTASPGLDDDPNASSADYGACTPAGLAGQASRIAAATGGAFATTLNPASIVGTIINLITAAVSQINNVSVVATGATAPLVVSISPAGGYGPLAGDKDHSLQFDVVFKAPPCRTGVTQIFNGALDVVADGSVVATKPVSITVPPCKPREVFSYSVKFVCGTASKCDCACGPVRPGIYATEINIHNPQDVEARLQKYVIPVVLAGAAAGREPGFVGRKASDRITLPPHSATMDDCCRLGELLFGAATGAIPLTIGFFEIISPVELSITAVYTATDAESRAISIDVEQIDGKKVSAPRRVVVPGTLDAGDEE